MEVFFLSIRKRNETCCKKKLNRILLKHHKTEQNFLTIKKVLLIIKWKIQEFNPTATKIAASTMKDKERTL